MNIQEVKIALAQIDCYLKDKNKNIAHTIDIIHQLNGKTDIICFPELFTTGYNLEAIGDDIYELAETIPGETSNRLGEEAKRCQMAIIGGIIEKDPCIPDVLYNSAFLINKKGEIVGKYRKYYLYPLEHKYFKQGKEIPVFNLNFIRLGMAICYDHAFPELFRVLTLRGAQVVFILSAIPTGYEYLLNLRAMARAQDNQIFVVHVNRVGQDREVRFCGLSKIVNPRGEVIKEASPASEDVLIGTIDQDMIIKEKRQERIIRSLRPEIYQDINRLL